MIFQMDIEYDGKDKLVKDGLAYINLPEIINNAKPMLKLNEIDPFFVDFIKKHNLGTKISGIGIHAMRPGSESEDPHKHMLSRAVYYIQAPEGVGSLTLPDRDVIIKPHDGLFVVVPAKERHGITMNMSDEIRLILAFYIE